MAEWSKAADLGSVLHWRGFESHFQHITFLQDSIKMSTLFQLSVIRRKQAQVTMALLLRKQEISLILK